MRVRYMKGEPIVERAARVSPRKLENMLPTALISLGCAECL
jgi:hypothetical protein